MIVMSIVNALRTAGLYLTLGALGLNTASCTYTNTSDKVDSNYESKVLIEKEKFIPVLYDPESYDELRTENDIETEPSYELSGEESNLIIFEMKDMLYFVSVSNTYDKTGRPLDVYKYNGDEIKNKSYDEIMECSEYINGLKVFDFIADDYEISNFKIVDSPGKLGLHMNADEIRDGKNELDIVLGLE
ncbi:MAG: hypothetical protein V1693_00480 [Nanoarchaeota archaeon]